MNVIVSGNSYWVQFCLSLFHDPPFLQNSSSSAAHKSIDFILLFVFLESVSLLKGVPLCEERVQTFKNLAKKIGNLQYLYRKNYGPHTMIATPVLMLNPSEKYHWETKWSIGSRITLMNAYFNFARFTLWRSEIILKNILRLTQNSVISYDFWALMTRGNTGRSKNDGCKLGASELFSRL